MPLPTQFSHVTMPWIMAMDAKVDAINVAFPITPTATFQATFRPDVEPLREAVRTLLEMALHMEDVAQGSSEHAEPLYEAAISVREVAVKILCCEGLMALA